MVASFLNGRWDHGINHSLLDDTVLERMIPRPRKMEVSGINQTSDSAMSIL